MRTAAASRARSPHVACAVVLAILVLGLGCAQILGADEPRALALSASTKDSDDGGKQTFDAIAVVPEAGDPNACAANEKRCDGICVSKSSPDYGCGSESCAPCSVPHAATVKCTDEGNKCAFRLCQPGWLGCGAATEGCTEENTSPMTCGNCGTPCSDPFPACTSIGCAGSCPVGTVNCTNACVAIESSATNCGGCGKKCPTKLNGDPECKKSACSITCRAGFDHCDGLMDGDCVALTSFYRDADGDGVGDATQPKKLACSQAAAGAGWATRAGDCHDGNKEVFPGQKLYFGVPYTTISGALSYDYDCDAVEVEEGLLAAHFGGCDANCNGGGLVPASSGRTGTGINDYCGSTQQLACTSAIVELSPQSVQSVHILAPVTTKPLCGSLLREEEKPNPCH